MSGIIAEVFHNGSDWQVDPPKITLDATNLMDHWGLSGVYSHLAPRIITDVKIVFSYGPGPGVLDAARGPFTSIPKFSGGALDGCPHNDKCGLYTYDVVVTFLDSPSQELCLFNIDPQIDNVAPPPNPEL